MELHDLYEGCQRYKALRKAAEEGYQPDIDEIRFVEAWEDDGDLEESERTHWEVSYED